MLLYVCVRLRFTLVSEPTDEEDDEDCVEIGYAYVSLNEILQTGRDLICAEIPSQQLTFLSSSSFCSSVCHLSVDVVLSVSFSR